MRLGDPVNMSAEFSDVYRFKDLCDGISFSLGYESAIPAPLPDDFRRGKAILVILSFSWLEHYLSLAPDNTGGSVSAFY